VKTGVQQPAVLIGALVIAFTSTYGAGAQPSAPTQPNLQLLSTDEIVQKLVAADQRRGKALRALQAIRFYAVDYHGFPGSRSANMKVGALYTAPDKKTFAVLSQSGSKFLINHVFQKLLASEQAAIQDQSGKGVQLTPENYEFAFLQVDQTPFGAAYVLQLKPRTGNKYLYRGKIWVDATDFAVVKIDAEPAKNPSFWISRTDIEQQYAKFGEFWLPVHNRSVTHVRLGGDATLQIDYTQYHINGAAQATGAHPGNSNSMIPPAASVSGDPH
jgi:hypothetical protein